MGDILKVNVFDLKDNSMVYVDVKCEYCGKEYKMMWLHRTKMHKLDSNHKDCCLECTPKKASETMMVKYNKSNSMFIEEFKEKLKETNLNKYGCENVFQNDEIKAKIKSYNLEKYGVESYTQTQECQDKKKATCLITYGETSHMKTQKYRLMYAKEKSPVWKGGIRTKRTERITLEYKNWRNSVFKKDDYKCSNCNENSTNLQAHHILSWRDNPDLRYIIENGITLCKTCHIEFHKIYGKTSATKDDLLKFIQKR